MAQHLVVVASEPTAPVSYSHLGAELGAVWAVEDEPAAYSSVWTVANARRSSLYRIMKVRLWMKK